MLGFSFLKDVSTSTTRSSPFFLSLYYLFTLFIWIVDLILILILLPSHISHAQRWQSSHLDSSGLIPFLQSSSNNPLSLKFRLPCRLRFTFLRTQQTPRCISHNNGLDSIVSTVITLHSSLSTIHPVSYNWIRNESVPRWHPKTCPLVY